MTEKKCRGCGAPLQTEDPARIGYVVSADMEYCQRCFRLIHYDQQTPIEIEAMKSLDYLNDVTSDYIWLIDASDMETSLNCGFAAFYREHEALVVLTKYDVLPATLTEKKLRNYVSGRLKSLGVRFSGIVIKGAEGSREKIRCFVRDSKRSVTVTGTANAGKSTFINWLTESNTLTVNPHPSTTLALNRIDTAFGTIFDSVGLVVSGSVQSHVDGNELKAVVVRQKLKPKVYQLNGDQSLAIGGLVRIDIAGCDPATAVVYCSDFLKCHRTGQGNADRLWMTHLGEDLSPAISSSFENMTATEFRYQPGKRDFCISGLGWVTVSGKYEKVTVFCDPVIDISSRKAMI